MDSEEIPCPTEINEATPEHDIPFWEREFESATEVWKELQRIQTDFCFGQEISCYFTEKSWHSARDVVDIGAGAGYYLQRLASVFPEKRYFGFDINDEFISMAERDHAAANIKFRQADFFEVSGQYDFLVMRLVMQHLSKPDAGLAKISKLLRPGGVTFVIDALDTCRFYHPRPENYIEFFNAYSRLQSSRGKDRDIAGKIPDMIHAHRSLSLKSAQEIIIPSTIPSNLALFEETYYLVIQLLELEGEMDYDYDKVRAAWREWCSIPNRYMQVGIRVLTIEKNDSVSPLSA